MSTAQVASELSARGHEVSVFCRSADSAASFRVVCLPGLPRGKRAALEHFIGQCRHVIDSGAFDVTHSVLPIPGASVYQPRGGIVPAQIEASVRRRPAALGGLVRFFNTFRASQQLLARLERQVMGEERTCILAVSELVAQDARRCYGCQRVRVVFNAVQVPQANDELRRQWRQEVRAQLGLPDDWLLVLTAGHNARLKGIGCAISAHDEFRRSSGVASTLLCLGLKGKHRPLQPGQPVQTLGHVSDIFRYYSAADVVLLLSWQDACSRVILEAVRWGVPSITTRYNGAAEVLAEGAGIVVESPDDSAGVAAALATMCDPASRAHMRRACLAKADYLSIRRHVDELEALYRELAR